jgi:hypothetical protein
MKTHLEKNKNKVSEKSMCFLLSNGSGYFSEALSGEGRI